MDRLFRPSSSTKYAVCSLFLLMPIVGTILVGISGTAEAQKPLTGKAKEGETVFKAQCIGCHNKAPGDTTPFGPPNLHGIIGTNANTTPPQITAQVAMSTVKTGKGIMPPFEGKLTPQEISNVVAYLKTQ